MNDKIALITGAAQGIGAATAWALCEQGVRHLLLLDIDEDALGALASELQDHYDELELDLCKTDIASQANIELTLRPLLNRIGKIDILVNNAGVADENEPDEIDIWHKVININLHGTYRVTREVLQYMSKGGRIINVSSILGKAGNPRNTAYCASKHALLGFTKGLALDVARQQITVNAVLPGWIDTPMLKREIQLQASKIGVTTAQMLHSAKKKIPLRRLIESREVANVIGFLASPAGSGITAQQYVIDGGYTCGM